jgi:hypothetical protein
VKVLGIVPQSYYDFVMHYAPYFYVITTAMSQDAQSVHYKLTEKGNGMLQELMKVEDRYSLDEG